MTTSPKNRSGPDGLGSLIRSRGIGLGCTVVVLSLVLGCTGLDRPSETPSPTSTAKPTTTPLPSETPTPTKTRIPTATPDSAQRTATADWNASRVAAEETRRVGLSAPKTAAAVVDATREAVYFATMRTTQAAYEARFTEEANTRATSAAAPPTAPPAARTVTLYCPDCAEVGMAINLWDSPTDIWGGAVVVGRRPHGTVCTVLAEDEDFTRVDCGGTTGWVQNTLLR